MGIEERHNPSFDVTRETLIADIKKKLNVQQRRLFFGMSPDEKRYIMSPEFYITKYIHEYLGNPESPWSDYPTPVFHCDATQLEKILSVYSAFYCNEGEGGIKKFGADCLRYGAPEYDEIYSTYNTVVISLFDLRQTEKEENFFTTRIKGTVESRRMDKKPTIIFCDRNTSMHANISNYPNVFKVITVDTKKLPGDSVTVGKRKSASSTKVNTNTIVNSADANNGNW